MMMMTTTDNGLAITVVAAAPGFQHVGKWPPPDRTLGHDGREGRVFLSATFCFYFVDIRETARARWLDNGDRGSRPSRPTRPTTLGSASPNHPNSSKKPDQVTVVRLLRSRLETVSCRQTEMAACSVLAGLSADMMSR
jgi:hypothetical protein